MIAAVTMVGLWLALIAAFAVEGEWLAAGICAAVVVLFEAFVVWDFHHNGYYWHGQPGGPGCGLCALKRVVGR